MTPGEHVHGTYILGAIALSALDVDGRTDALGEQARVIGRVPLAPCACAALDALTPPP